MPKAGDIKYCDILGGRKTNAAFVYVPSSAFWMGDASVKDNPVHLVGVSKGFWIQQTPLTEEQTQYWMHPDTFKSGSSTQPETDMSYNDIMGYNEKTSLRMPTEAEWELAARAGVGHKYLWSGSNVVNNVAWTDTNSNRQTEPVANLKSNSFGLYDSSGNVNEWCSDWVSILDSAPQFNPQGPASGDNRISRGGSWFYALHSAQVARRYGIDPDNRFPTFGVRLVWEI